MAEVRITATGRLTADPEVGDVNGKTKCQFTLATTPQMFKDGSYQDLPPVFTTVEFWGGIATAVAAKYRRGSLVVVTGVMRAKEYENRAGEQKRFQYLRGEEVGDHVADRNSTSNPGDARSATESARGADGGSNWGGYPAGAANGPYSPNSSAPGPYDGAGQSNPYGSPRWGQP